MAQLVGSRLSRLAMRAGAAVCVAGVTTVALSLTPVEASPPAASTTPYAYVANDASGNVSVIDTSTNAVVKTVTVGSKPDEVAIAPNESHAYVTNYGSDTVSVIKTSTNKVVKTVTVGSYPYWVAITPNGSYAYVTNLGSGTVSVINTSTNAVVNTVTVGGQPYGVAIT
jgi:YVTN family beta-propeller protein